MSPSLGSASEWLSRKQASQRLGISVSTLKRLMAEGDAPAYVIVRRQSRFTAAAITTYLAAREVRPQEAQQGAVA